jgi:hypothetical protein
MYPSCSIAQENTIFDSANDRSSLEFEKVLDIGIEKVLFHSEHLLELLYQEDRVMKRNTSRVMKHNLILQGAMSPTHRRKSGMDD